jgi:hypothetical protein
MAHEGEGTLVAVIPGDQAPDIIVLAKLDNQTAAEIRTTWYPRSNARHWCKATVQVLAAGFLPLPPVLSRISRIVSSG